MTEQIDFIQTNKSKVELCVIKCIDNKTMHTSLFLSTNVMCDGLSYYIGKEPVSVKLKNKKALRLLLSRINGKMWLSSTNNDFYNTRLIYKVVFK